MASIGPSLVDRRKAGSKHHIPNDGRGTPLAIRLTGAERAFVGPTGGRPRSMPAGVVGDAAYGSRANCVGVVRTCRKHNG